MTITCLPIDAAAGAPAYTAQNTRQAFSGLLYNGTSRALGAQSGIAAGHQPVLSATSATWSVGAGAFIIDAAFTTTQAPYLVSNDQAVTGSMTAAHATLDRYDSLYLQVNDTAIDSSGSRNGAIGYTAGTASSTPTVPAVPARSILIGYIFVPHSGAGSPSVTMYLATSPVAAGGVLPVSSIASRDSLITNPVDGMACWTSDSNLMWMYDGAAWVVQSPRTQVYTATALASPATNVSGNNNLVNTISLPSVPYATVVTIACGTLITAQLAGNQSDIWTYVNSGGSHRVRGPSGVTDGSGTTLADIVSVAANTAVTLAFQASKVVGSNTTTFTNDASLTYMVATVRPA
jgi:hypothetical protein